MFTIGFAPRLKDWRIHFGNVYDFDSTGREIIIGRGLAIGPFAFWREFDGASYW